MSGETTHCRRDSTENSSLRGLTPFAAFVGGRMPKSMATLGTIRRSKSKICMFLESYAEDTTSLWPTLSESWWKAPILIRLVKTPVKGNAKRGVSTLVPLLDHGQEKTPHEPLTSELHCIWFISKLVYLCKLNWYGLLQRNCFLSDINMHACLIMKIWDVIHNVHTSMHLQL